MSIDDLTNYYETPSTPLQHVKSAYYQWAGRVIGVGYAYSVIGCGYLYFVKDDLTKALALFLVSSSVLALGSDCLG